MLKPKFIKPPPKDPKWNYIIDIFTKWHSSFFYFCSTYACPGPNAHLADLRVTIRPYGVYWA